MQNKTLKWILGVLPVTAVLLCSAPWISSIAVAADDNKLLQAAFHPPQSDPGMSATVTRKLSAPSEELVFGAPPRGTLAEETAVYQPVVDFLSQVIGKKVAYQYTGNWLSYSKSMTEGGFDIVFDGPAFNGWRMDHLNHTPLVKLPELFVFVIVTRADDSRYKTVKDLAGRRICAHAPPNLGTLTLLSQFDNPMRQPLIVETKGWDNNYKALISGQCVATVLPLENLHKMDDTKRLTRILYTNKALPNQAFSVGPRVPASLHARIAQALLSDEGKQATAALRAAYAGKNFVYADRSDYAGLGGLLKSSLYYQ
jgi:ABC-type phosphate/phosphonate transport system substrate-binding protein